MQCWFVYRISLKAYSFAECRSLIASNHEPSYDCETFLLKCYSLHPSCPPHYRHHLGVRPAELQHVLSRCDLLLLPWRAADEDAPDAGASSAGLQSYHRFGCFVFIQTDEKTIFKAHL